MCRGQQQLEVFSNKVFWRFVSRSYHCKYRQESTFCIYPALHLIVFVVLGFHFACLRRCAMMDPYSYFFGSHEKCKHHVMMCVWPAGLPC